jgi:hypothetical protein
MSSEEMDAIIAEYERIRTDAQAGMRGAINTLGIDAAIDIAANRSDDLKELYTLSGILRAVFDAGRLAGVR